MLTFQKLCDAYLASLQGRPSARRYRQVYRQHLQPWGSHFAHDLTRRQILKFQQERPMPLEQMRKALGLIRQAYKWAGRTLNPVTDDLYYGGPNPAIGLQITPADSRERLASHEELIKILRELPYLHPRHAAFFAVRLTAPSRIAELDATEPGHFRRCEMVPGYPGAAIWSKYITKNGKAQNIYVAPQAMKYLDALPWSGKYFFQGAHGQHWTEGTARKAWWELMAHLNIGTDCPRHCQKHDSDARQKPCQCLQLLDIRRTLASYLYRLHRRQDVDDLTIKALLNHYDGRPVAIYTRLDLEYLSKILQGYADWLWNLPGTIPEPEGRLDLVPPLDEDAELMEVPG